MRRIVRGAVAVLGAGMVIAGCGSQNVAVPAKVWSSASLTAAVLSQQDMPRGFLPAEAQEAFQGVVPRDPDCRRLLALADGHGLRDVPKASAAFYRVAPGATVSQQVLHLGEARAQEMIIEARRSIGLCPVVKATVGGTRMLLRREQMSVPGLDPGETVAVRYRQKASANYVISYEIVMSRQGEDLLVVGHPGLTHRRVPSVAVEAAKRAAAKLAEANKLLS